MVSCVAFVDDQLNVEESPLLIEVGSADSVTVVWGLGCSTGAGGGGVVATGFFLQPPANTVATIAATNKARYNGRETTAIRILLRRTWNTRVRPTEGNIVTPAGWFRAISRITIYSTCNEQRRERKFDWSEKPQASEDSALRYRSG
jgi:hypothetical protein